MSESTVVRTKHDFSAVITDASAAHSYTVAVQPGDQNYAAPGFSIVDILDNGVPYGVRLGDGGVCSGGFSAHLRDIGSTSYATLPDICEQRSGSYAVTTWVSTSANDSDVPTYDYTATIDGAVAGEADKSLVFPDAIFRGSADFGASASYKVTWRCATAMAPTLA